jgi:3-oxoacyl-[acyl-carrier protein] reductase
MGHFGVDLSGRVALVTGASRGIGRAIAQALADAGADVAVNCHQHVERAQAVAAAIRSGGRRAIVIAADVSQRQAVLDMVARVARELAPPTFS